MGFVTSQQTTTGYDFIRDSFSATRKTTAVNPLPDLTNF